MAYTFDNPLRKLVHPPEKILQPYVQERMRVLDIGCGFGHFAIGMAKIVGPGGRVTALDLQEQMLNKTMSRKQGLVSTIEPKRCNGGDLGPAEAYDFVLASNVLQEIPDLPTLAGQISCVLKPGGLFYTAVELIHLAVEEVAFQTVIRESPTDNQALRSELIEMLARYLLKNPEMLLPESRQQQTNTSCT